jgi:alkylhydroperoxidase/carboxymuconolactone decarboxylase family protein YurZ
MAEEKTDKKVQDFIDKMKKERGPYVPAPMVYLANKDLPFIEAYDNLYNAALQDGKALPAKYRELVCIGILAHRGFEDICVSHIKRALKLGATKQEILDAIETMIIPGGAPTFGVGLNALIKVEEEEKKANG